jgi:hypothetical protein
MPVIVTSSQRRGKSVLAFATVRCDHYIIANLFHSLRWVRPTTVGATPRRRRPLPYHQPVSMGPEEAAITIHHGQVSGLVVIHLQSSMGKVS